MREWRAVGRHQHSVLTANDHRALGISSVLDVLFRGAALDDFPAHTVGETNAGASDLCARRFKQVQDLGIIEKVDTNFGQQLISVLLDQRQPFLT